MLEIINNNMLDQPFSKDTVVEVWNSNNNTWISNYLLDYGCGKTVGGINPIGVWRVKKLNK